MKIRPATADDIAEITAIYARSVLEEYASFELTPPSQVEMEERMCSLTRQGYPYLVAELDGTIAGYAYGSAYRPRPAYKTTVEDTVYVSPDYLRRGVARALLAALVTDCRKAGYRQMIGMIACEPDVDHKTIASIRLHEKAGFKKSGHVTAVGFKHKKWLDVVTMQLTL